VFQIEKIGTNPDRVDGNKKILVQMGKVVNNWLGVGKALI